jgi:DNA repair photolyase
MEQVFWCPTITSQIAICPVPFHLDTYRGCSYNCSYCFARDFVTFHRKRVGKTDIRFTTLVANDPVKFRAWVDKVEKSDYDYRFPERVAFKERIPLKLGATADPFPPIEHSLRVTYEFLSILHEIDYPVEIQTKNPELLLDDCYRVMDSANHVVAVTIISLDDDFVKVCEPGAISVQRRLSAIRELTDLGKKVIVKVQPAIYPKILDDLPSMVPAFVNSGAFAFNIEGLKIRISMPVVERLIMQKIGDYLDVDIRKFMQSENHITSSDYEISLVHKLEYIKLAQKLATQHGIDFYVADNCHYKYSCDSECCGTKVLHDYRLWANNERTRMFPVSNPSTEFGKSLFTGTRNRIDRKKTIDQVILERDIINSSGQLTFLDE